MNELNTFLRNTITNKDPYTAIKYEKLMTRIALKDPQARHILRKQKKLLQEAGGGLCTRSSANAAGMDAVATLRGRVTGSRRGANPQAASSQAAPARGRSTGPRRGSYPQAASSQAATHASVGAAAGADT